MNENRVPRKCRRQKWTMTEKRLRGETSRECADDAGLKPNKPFECALPRHFRVKVQWSYAGDDSPGAP